MEQKTDLILETKIELIPGTKIDSILETKIDSIPGTKTDLILGTKIDSILGTKTDLVQDPSKTESILVALLILGGAVNCLCYKCGST